MFIDEHHFHCNTLQHTYQECIYITFAVIKNDVCIEERWGAGVEYHFQEFHEPYAPS